MRNATSATTTNPPEDGDRRDKPEQQQCLQQQLIQIVGTTLSQSAAEVAVAAVVHGAGSLLADVVGGSQVAAGSSWREEDATSGNGVRGKVAEEVQDSGACLCEGAAPLATPEGPETQAISALGCAWSSSAAPCNAGGASNAINLYVCRCLVLLRGPPCNAKGANGSKDGNRTHGGDEDQSASSRSQNA